MTEQTEAPEVQELVLDEDGKASFPVCPKHGIHNHMLSFNLGEQSVAFCALCLIEKLDALSVHRMGIVKLTKEEFEQLQQEQQAPAEAAE